MLKVAPILFLLIASASCSFIYQISPPLMSHYYPQYQIQSNQGHGQVVPVNRPQFVAINSASSASHTIPSAVAVPVKPQNNIVAIHSNEGRRKIVSSAPNVYVHPNYSFNYAVKDIQTGDEKSHQETRVGNTVIGKYTLVDPDGFLREVSYSAGEGGFRAVVKRTPGYAKPNAPTNINNKIVAISRPSILLHRYPSFYYNV